MASEVIISDNGYRGSVVTFSSTAELSIKFSDHKEISTFNAAVDSIPLMGYQTRIDKALRLTQSQMFTRRNGARVGAR